METDQKPDQEKGDELLRKMLKTPPRPKKDEGGDPKAAPTTPSVASAC